MGQAESVADEKKFWSAWYPRTGNWGVGPAVTVYNNPRINQFNNKATMSILKQYKQSDGSFRLPPRRKGF